MSVSSGLTPDGIAQDRRIPPAQYVQTFLAGDSFDDTFADQTLLGFHRQEHHADAVFAAVGKREAQGGTFPDEKLMRNLDQNSGSVTGFRVASAGSTVR
jgi:hypothetical protein